MKLDCPHCGDNYVYDARYAGSTADCKYCGLAIAVPTVEQLSIEERTAYLVELEKHEQKNDKARRKKKAAMKKPPEKKPPVKKRPERWADEVETAERQNVAKSTPWADRSGLKALLSVGAVLGLLVFLTFFGCPQSLVLIDYGALLAFLACTAALLTLWRRQSWRTFAVALGASSAVALAILVPFDRCTVWWENTIDATPWNETDSVFETIYYTDTRLRWQGDILYRELRTVRFSKDENALSLYAAGPMSASHKQHGHWTSHTYDDFPPTHTWYWYGEEITEGEWHLRNK